MTAVMTKVAELREENSRLIAEAEKSDRSELFQIALRDYLGKPKDEDAERLLELFVRLDVTDKHYSDLVAGMERICGAVAESRVILAIMRTHEEDYAQARRNMLTATAEVNKWQRQVNVLKSRPSESIRIASELNAVKRAFPSCFDADGEPIAELSAVIKKQTKDRKDDLDKADADYETLRLNGLQTILQGQELSTGDMDTAESKGK